MPHHKFANRNTNSDFRQNNATTLPPDEEMEGRLRTLLSPAALASVRRPEGVSLRDRVLTLPVMAAIVVSLVWRRIPSLAEVLRVLSAEGLLEVPAQRVSEQALSKRLQRLPAEMFATLLSHVVERVARERQQRQERQERQASRTIEAEDSQKDSQPLAHVRKRFSGVWIADASTLEAIKRKLLSLRAPAPADGQSDGQSDGQADGQADGQEGGGARTLLGGKILAVVDAFSHTPAALFYEKESAANERKFIDRLLEHLTRGALVLFDRGFFTFSFFDRATEAGVFFLTRQRARVQYVVLSTLSEGACFRDEIVQMGEYRSNPCKHPVRIVSVLWGGVWYQYVTNVLDPAMLSACEVAQLYRRRWRIEEAFLQTKRLLGLAYLWVGGKNGIEIQVYATWIFYTVLVDLCEQVAERLSVPLDRISVQMVYRAFYHVGSAQRRGDTRDAVTFLADNAQMLGIVKKVRKRTSDKQEEDNRVWADALS
jgi:hypothetical protein